ncbi:MAG: TAXI family TRAP transporter solute-binding subunit [Rhodocyclaceae bacterium]|nr:TAXI family TRAP transporter solute-binding subunit [Rhodocyclaceae bacterium]
MKSYWLAIIALAAALAGAPAQAAPDTLVLGTATAGGGFELYGQHLAAALAETDASLKIEIRATRGSAENLPLLEAGKLDIGLVEGNAAHAAFEGIDRPKTALRIVAAIYPGPGMFVARGNSALRTLADLQGKPVAFGTPASGLTKLAREVLDGLGLTPERDFQAVFLDKAGDGPDLVLAGKVVALWGGGIGWPGFAKVAAGPDGARFIVPNADEIGRIQAKHPYLRSMVVPAGTYAGQEAPIQTVGLWSFVLARADLPDEVAYRLARALHRGEAKLAARLAQGRYTTAANTASEAPRAELLHPGTARYLREIGALR